MTEAAAFDVHPFVERLTGSGLTERQAGVPAEQHVSSLLDGKVANRIRGEPVSEGWHARHVAM